jgi:DHA1 family bicyclomycin/chloramphenicol resistance-like MFS transporter
MDHQHRMTIRISEAQPSGDARLSCKPSGQSLHVMAILSTLMGFASISTDLYLPALPRMASALGATTGQVEWTISGYLVGFSLGQLLWGPISDRYGRRSPVAAGLVLFCMGSAGCALSDSVWAMIGWRAVQAVGAVQASSLPAPWYAIFSRRIRQQRCFPCLSPSWPSLR